MQYAVGKSPIFIGGAPRSGTTLLRAIVNASRNIVCGPEMRVIPALCHLAEQIETSHLDVLSADYGLDADALNARFAKTIDTLLSPLHARTGAAQVDTSYRPPLFDSAFWVERSPIQGSGAHP